MFDLQQFTDASVAGIPLVIFVMAMVTWLSDVTGAAGKVKLLISMAVGLVIGIGYQISLAMPQSFAAWFAVAIYGLALGLLASGTYDTGKMLVEHIVRKTMDCGDSADVG